MYIIYTFLHRVVRLQTGLRKESLKESFASLEPDESYSARSFFCMTAS